MTGLIPTNEPLTPWTRDECVSHIRSQIRPAIVITAAKLYPAEVAEIRDLLAEGEMSRRDIAERFNVSTHAIYDIANGKSWKSAA